MGATGAAVPESGARQSASAPPPLPQSNRRPNQRWVLAEPHPKASADLAKAARLPHVLAELLVSRGITQARDAFAFLNPELSHLHDPMQMLGMDAAVARLEQAIAQHQPVLLYGDYDVDGTTAVVLLKTAIEMLGGIVRFHVPHRLREGYGLQSSVLQAAYAEGVHLDAEGLHRDARVQSGLALSKAMQDQHVVHAVQQGTTRPPCWRV